MAGWPVANWHGALVGGLRAELAERRRKQLDSQTAGERRMAESSVKLQRARQRLNEERRAECASVSRAEQQTAQYEQCKVELAERIRLARSSGQEAEKRVAATWQRSLQSGEEWRRPKDTIKARIAQAEVLHSCSIHTYTRTECTQHSCTHPLSLSSQQPCLSFSLSLSLSLSGCCAVWQLCVTAGRQAWMRSTHRSEQDWEAEMWEEGAAGESTERGRRGAAAAPAGSSRKHQRAR